MHHTIAALGAPRARLTLAYLALVAGERLPRLLRSATRASPRPSDRGIDLGALLAVAVGAHALAGYALRPVREARARQELFAAAASHELRTPVTVLLGTLEATLLRPRAPEEYERIVRRAVEEAALLAALLDDILPFAHDDDPAPPTCGRWRGRRRRTPGRPAAARDRRWSLRWTGRCPCAATRRPSRGPSRRSSTTP